MGDGETGLWLRRHAVGRLAPRQVIADCARLPLQLSVQQHIELSTMHATGGTSQQLSPRADVRLPVIGSSSSN